MYSKSKGITERDRMLTPPPGYDGSRFRRRSDGRDDAFYNYSETRPRAIYHCPEKEAVHEKDEVINDAPEIECRCEDDLFSCDKEVPVEKEESQAERSLISSFIQSLGNEEILLIALILLLANDSKGNIDTVLILALLLCVSR